MTDIEVHPFEPFIPHGATVLIVGSFPGRQQTQLENKEDAWFYGAKRNQFWTIISHVYNVELHSAESKKALFTKYGIGITDIFRRIRRKENNNMDSNLEVIEYNGMAITNILDHHHFNAIFFTSRFVEKHFMKLFPAVKNGKCLPSPSPRFAKMSITEKIKQYKASLPADSISAARY